MMPIENEIATNPAWAGDTDQQVADRLNQTQTTLRAYLVNAYDLEDRWGATRAGAILARLRTIAANTGLTDAQREGAQTILLGLNGSGWDLGRPTVRSRFPQLVSASVFTQAEADELLALAETTIIRAMQIIGRLVTAADVALGRWQWSMRQKHIAGYNRVESAIDAATDTAGTWDGLALTYKGV